MATGSNPDKMYSRFVVTWQVNHGYPRRYCAWVNLGDAKSKIESLLQAHKELEMESWAEYPIILESIDDYYKGSCKGQPPCQTN